MYYRFLNTHKICTRWLPLRTAIISILRRSVAEYLVMPYGILIYTAAIAGVAFDGVDYTVLDLFYNTRMVG